MKKHLLLIVLIALSCLPLFDLFMDGIPATHDGVDHVARIANFYLSLSEGNSIPRWAGNLNWGYGHPILMFLYPLPSYVASIFHFFGLSFVNSTKIVFGVGFVASSVAMYLWLSSFIDRKAAFLGALAYALAPYRFIDLYVRGAIGEHVAFIFPPLVCFSLFALASSKKRWPIFLGSLSLCGLLLSHNAISLMFLPIFVLYFFYLYFTEQKTTSFVVQVICVLVCGFLLSAFFWVPAFFEGKYTLRDIVTKNEYLNRFETLDRFLYGRWSYGGTGQFSVQIGVFQWLGLVLSPLVFLKYLKVKSNLWLLLAGSFVLFFVTLFLMTKTSLPMWEIVTILQKFQFPWRLLSVSVFLCSIMIALIANAFKDRLSLGIIAVFVVLLLFFNMNYGHAKGFIRHPEAFYTGIYNGTTDTGESAPIWSVRFMEHRARNQSEVIDGAAQITRLARSTTNHEYLIVANAPSRIVENTLYFPGWRVSVNGKKVPIEFQDPRFRGLITYFVPKGVNAVTVKFSETKLRLISDLISLVVFVLLVGYAVYLFSQRLWRSSQ